MAPIGLLHWPHRKQARCSDMSPNRTTVSLGQKSSWQTVQKEDVAGSVVESVETLVVELED